MLFEDNTHVFIVRVWLEPREIEGAPLEWRGSVEHVPSGNRCYVKELGEIAGFVAPYLKQMGVKHGLCTRIKRWLNR